MLLSGEATLLEVTVIPRVKLENLVNSGKPKPLTPPPQSQTAQQTAARCFNSSVSAFEKR